MDNVKANRSIKCSVKQCANHCNSQDYCSLSNVSIGSHESRPTKCQCVDCESFRVKHE